MDVQLKQEQEQEQELTLNGAKMVDLRATVVARSLVPASSFWRFATGPFSALLAIARMVACNAATMRP